MTAALGAFDPASCQTQASLPFAREQEMTGTVWIVNPTKHDVKSAETYGTVKYVNHRFVYPDELVDGHIPPSFDINISQCVGEFKPDTDFLVLAGDPLQLVLFAARLAWRYSQISVMRYDQQAEGYIPIKMGIVSAS